MKQTIGEKYLKPNPKCTSCRGSGWVTENHPWGDTTASETIGCSCVEKTLPLTYVLLEWLCPQCECVNADYPSETTTPICSSCNSAVEWYEICPDLILQMVKEIDKFIDGVYDDKTEEEMAEDISEKLWSEE